MTPAESKARMKADAAVRAAATPPQNMVTDRAPTAYVAPQLNVPRSFHETVLILQEEFTRIEQVQSYLLSLLNELKASIPAPAPDGVLTINGEVPDAAGNVVLDAADVGAQPREPNIWLQESGEPENWWAGLYVNQKGTGARLLDVYGRDDVVAFNAPAWGQFLRMYNDGSLNLQSGSGQASLTGESNAVVRSADFVGVVDVASAAIYFRAGDSSNAYLTHGVWHAGAAHGFRQPAETAWYDGSSWEENRGPIIYGNWANNTQLTTVIAIGQYYAARVILGHDGYEEAWEFRGAGQFWAPGQIYQNGGQPVTALDQVQRMIEVNVAVLRSEIMSEMGRRLDAAGIPHIQN